MSCIPPDLVPASWDHPTLPPLHGTGGQGPYLSSSHRSMAALAAAISRAAEERSRRRRSASCWARGGGCSSMVLLPSARWGRTIVGGAGLTKGEGLEAPDPAVHRILTEAAPQQLLAVDSRARPSTEKSRRAVSARARRRTQGRASATATSGVDSMYGWNTDRKAAQTVRNMGYERGQAFRDRSQL